MFCLLFIKKMCNMFQVPTFYCTDSTHRVTTVKPKWQCVMTYLEPSIALVEDGIILTMFVCFCCAFCSLFNGPQWHDANMSSRS